MIDTETAPEVTELAEAPDTAHELEADDQPLYDAPELREALAVVLGGAADDYRPRD